MASSMRTAIFNPRPLRSFVASARPTAARSYATIPTKNTTPSPPLEPSKTQAMPIGAFYEAILNSKQPIPDVKPEEPATTVKENLAAADAAEESSAAAAPAKRGRKPKAATAAASPTPPKTDPAATATASTAPTASPAATAKATAKEAANAAKASSVSSSPPPTSPEDDDGEAEEPPLPFSSSSSSSPESISASTMSTQEKAKVIFGTRLAGPVERAERLAQMRSKSTLIAGVLVPPKPEEPDNCCMSGCVNCVWDLFRDEMEAWALANDEAERRLTAAVAAAAPGQGKEGGDGRYEQHDAEEKRASSTGPVISQQQQPPPPPPQQRKEQSLPSTENVAMSMDDDGGGSDTNWQNIGGETGQGPLGQVTTPTAKKEFWNEELYKSVPVGIREFMKQEKRLKEKHLREGTTGG